MLIIKVKHQTGPEAEYADILIEGTKRVNIFFVLSMLEQNDRVVQYEIMNSTMTSFDLVKDLKEEFVFSPVPFSKFKPAH